ncbi:uncharacterized protein EDB91DRAFT_1249918 [Suillus paluster]|uniref:uncharacterized protein n=1 Tax=Suillus paluster TaxID=48578 RepID=UPI001B87BE72|nr:uncharacterized protein EDB91DRAFT_1249918 [Suillus paluster]KAG1736612.1 hypothetical protein EDB91DRAFT_1249918 [Suillus paluster]
MANTLSPSDLKRYAKEMRKLSTQRVQKPWHRSSCPHVKRSAAEKSAARKWCKEFHTEYSAALAAAQDIIWEQAIQLRENHAKWLTNVQQLCWNAFVRQEVKCANDVLPPGTECQKAPAMMKDLSERWKDMLKDEHEAIMEDAVGDLNDHGKRTLASIDRKLAALNARTGMKIIMLAVHSDVDHFNQPHVFHTERAHDFFTACLKSLVHDFAFRLEGFCVAGVQGLAKTHIKEVIQLKRQISELVLQKLQTVAALQKVSQMYYQNFDTNVTAQYRIIIENWLLAKFWAPSDISSHNELSVLYCAWESDATQFRCLTDTEFELWEEDQFQAALVRQNEATVEGTQLSEHPLESSPVTTDTVHPNNTDPQTQPQLDANPRPSGSSQPCGRKRKAPSAEKKARKERSDKGKACGPRKKVPTDVPQESEVPPVVNSPPLTTAAHATGAPPASAE